MCWSAAPHTATVARHGAMPARPGPVSCAGLHSCHCVSQVCRCAWLRCLAGRRLWVGRLLRTARAAASNEASAGGSNMSTGATPKPMPTKAEREAFAAKLTEFRGTLDPTEASMLDALVHAAREA